jgi:hypothetical protein
MVPIKRSGNKMKRVIIVLSFFMLLLNSVKASPQTELKSESYAYHTFTVKDRDYNIQQEHHGDGAPIGMIIFAEDDDAKYLVVSLGKDPVYEIQIVNTMDIPSESGTKCIGYQGGMKFQGSIVVINVIFFYDTDKNTEIPETVGIDVNGSPTIMELSGLVKLNN